MTPGTFPGRFTSIGGGISTDDTMRDYIGPEDFAALCERHGIEPSTTVIFYGDKSNWWACYAFWVFQLVGHDNARVLDGGRDNWVSEGRRMTREVREFERSEYPVPEARRDDLHRAYFDATLKPHGGGLAHGRCALARRIRGQV